MAFALSSLNVTSTAFDPHGPMSARHTQEAEDLSPALAWGNVPDGTRGFAVICHDPDAPLVQHGHYGFVHWVLYNLPGDIRSLDEGSSQGVAGTNDAGKTAYSGPLPPEGHGLHLYYFWVLALDTQTDLPEGLSLHQLLTKVEPHLLGMNRVVGTYVREP
ncbi:YbhB/YbcL family Raf kinase inhibitor-like protein [Halomonas sp. V046]|uniref:YbhB/YbcL family Raf kinase inhibitor-like protein n=1 Tax=Halomonas sp. V046 TaxID=3459611 RepID=UPI0040442B2D